MHPRIYIASLILALSLLVAPTTAAAAPSADSVLRNLAAHQTHGWAHINLSHPQLEAKVARGEHIYVPCGVVSILAQRALTRHGYRARLVGAVGREQSPDLPQGVAETHAMIEIWHGYWGWIIYDVDGNVQPVDEHDQPINAITFAQMPERHYRTLAEDAAYNTVALRFEDYETKLFEDVEAWRDRVLDTITIRPPGTTWYYYGTENPIMAGWGRYTRLSPGRWMSFVYAAPA